MHRMFFVGLLLAALLAAACSSDPDSPLGTEFRDGGLIGGEPGEVFQDTINVAGGDTSFVTNGLVLNADSITVGRVGDIETAMVLRFDLSTAPDVGAAWFGDSQFYDPVLQSIRIQPDGKGSFTPNPLIYWPGISSESGKVRCTVSNPGTTTRMSSSKTTPGPVQFTGFSPSSSGWTKRYWTTTGV